jgi:hypothetical protein
MEEESSGVCVFCVESLPRLKTVQFSVHTDYHQLSISNQSIIAKERSQNKDEMGIELASCQLDLAKHSLVNVASSILSVKMCSSSTLSPRGVAPPGDAQLPEPSAVVLQCGFCNTIITCRDM